MIRGFFRCSLLAASLSSFVSYADSLKIDSFQSLRAVTPGAESHFLRHFDSLASMANMSASSEGLLKADATFHVVRGLADGNCFSFESSNYPGHYLRHRDFRVRKDLYDGTDTYRKDATFCSKPALDKSDNISLESKNMPGYFMRHKNGEVWMEVIEDNDLAHQDASWHVAAGLWKSKVSLVMNSVASLRVARPGFTDRYIRHFDSWTFTASVSGGSDGTLKRDATFRIVPGLAENSCYSFESTNFPGHFLRHSSFRIRKDPRDDSKLFAEDATFCAERGLSGYGVSFRSYNFPEKFLRHAFTEVWISVAGEHVPGESQGSFAEDASWDISPAW